MEILWKESRKIKLISECYVKPINHVASEASKKPIYLGGTDIFMLTMDTMQKGLLFNTKLQSDTLTRLKKALYVSLVYFYPLAGQLAAKKFVDEHACCFYIDCEAGPGARLIHAAVDYTVSDIVSSVDVHPIVESFFDLGEKSVNYDGITNPLLSIQVTELHDGAFIGFTMNHCVADGTSLWHFITTLSEIFSQIKDDEEKDDSEKSWIDGEIISRKPICDTLFPLGGYGLTFKLPYLEPEEFIIRYDPGPLRVRIFHFSSESISTLKTKAIEECGGHKNISSFQALCGFMIGSISRARNLRRGDAVRCTILINARTRFDPPLPFEYFRCFLSSAPSVSNMGDLMSGNLGRAALLVHESIAKQDEKYFRKLVQHLEAHPCVIQQGSGRLNYNPDNITFGGSSKFDMYGPEFGLGKAVVILAGYANRDDGKVTANPGRAGGGSIDLEICLKHETMNALKLDQEFMSFVSLD